MVNCFPQNYHSFPPAPQKVTQTDLWHSLEESNRRWAALVVWCRPVLLLECKVNVGLLPRGHSECLSFSFSVMAVFTTYKSQRVSSPITSRSVSHFPVILSQPRRPWEFLREAAKASGPQGPSKCIVVHSQLRARRFKRLKSFS